MRASSGATPDPEAPLGFMATSLAFYLPFDQLLSSRLLGKPAEGPFLLQLLSPAFFWFNVLVLAAMLHLPFRLFGGKAPMRGSLGMVLHVTGGPLILTHVLGFTCDRLSPGPARPPDVRSATTALRPDLPASQRFHRVVATYGNVASRNAV